MKWIFGIITVAGVLIIGLSLYLQPNSFVLCPGIGEPATRKGCNPADAIVVVSGGDTSARTQAAIGLYQRGWAPLIVFSGAAEDKSGPSNAYVMRSLAMHQDVPASAIIIEEVSENTRENAAQTTNLLIEHNIQDVILVTSGYHQRRASLEFQRASEETDIVLRNHPTNDKDWGWWWWLTPRGWYLAVSEFGRIVALYVQGIAS